MDINKILFEQLNLLGMQNLFTVEELDGSDAVQKETVQEENTEIQEEILSALNAQDEDSSLVLDDKSSLSLNKVQKNLSNTQILMNVLSNEAQALENDAEDIKEEIQAKNEEYEKLAQEIEEKQEEYNSLVSKAENSNDESIINEANELGEEINSMVGDLESLKSSIGNLENTLASKQKITNTFNSQLNSLSKVRSTLNKEAVKESAAVNSVSLADALQDVNGVNETAQSQATSGKAKREIKSMDEYMAIMDEKYADLFSKLKSMDAQSARKLMNQSTVDATNEHKLDVMACAHRYASEFYDADGDGRVTEIDKILWKNYLNKYNSEFSDSKSYTDGITSTEGLKSGIETGVRTITNSLHLALITQTYGTQYNLDDLEQINKLLETSAYTKEQLGVGNGFGYGMELNITEIAKDDNWEQKLDNSPINQAYIKGADIKARVENARKFIEQNPDNAQYASVAAAYQVYLANCEKVNQILNNTDNYDGTEAITTYDVNRYNTNVDKAYEMSGIHFSQGQLYNMVKGQIIEDKYSKTTLGIDLNGDGKMTFKDLNDFCTELDLDGDGNISKEEKDFLQGLKQQLYAKVSRVAEFSIEEETENVINYLDFKENNSFVSDMQEGVYKVFKDFAAEKFGDDIEKYKDKDGLLNTSLDSSQNSIARWKMALAEQTSGVWATYGTFPTIGVTYDVVVNLRDRIKNNNYSQQELQAILDKIKSASATAQSQLAEVKKLVEQKLANIK